MDNTKELTTLLSFCTGYGGIERGIERVIGPVRTVAHVEIEAYAIQNLVEKMENSKMVPCPVWTDVKTFPVHAFRGKVDILTGGYPCQPFSAAGKRQGTDDPRHLWPYIRRAVKSIRPSMCFFENVEGHISLGLSTVISDLEEDGYTTTWGIFSAAEVGAPHQRKRVFILAYSEREGLRGRLADSAMQYGGSEQERRESEVATSTSCKSVADCNQQGLEGVRPQRENQGGGETDRYSRPSNTTLWPARPGEDQYEWEEPRVI